MKHTIIGRIAEMEILEQLLKSDRPGLLAIYGRRRVGKTYLIKNYYAGHLKFACSGECGGSLRTQLANFQQQLNTWFPTNRQLQAPANWQQAFIMLRECLDTVKTKGKKVIFFSQRLYHMHMLFIIIEQRCIQVLKFTCQQAVRRKAGIIDCLVQTFSPLNGIQVMWYTPGYHVQLQHLVIAETDIPVLQVIFGFL